MDLRTQAEQLARRPYLLVTSIEESTDNQPIHIAHVLEIEGCFGQGATQEDAIKDLHLAMVDFIESLLEDNLHIPEPSRLTNTATGAGSEITVTFIGRGNRLRPKHGEIHHDAYILSSHAA